nr:MAG TPA: hypothetical protein [Caudoviricetes sp.]
MVIPVFVFSGFLTSNQELSLVYYMISFQISTPTPNTLRF